MQTPVLLVVACLLVAASARPLITSDGKHSLAPLWGFFCAEYCPSPFVILWAVQGPSKAAVESDVLCQGSVSVVRLVPVAGSGSCWKVPLRRHLVWSLLRCFAVPLRSVATVLTSFTLYSAVPWDLTNVLTSCSLTRTGSATSPTTSLGASFSVGDAGLMCPDVCALKQQRSLLFKASRLPPKFCLARSA